MSYVLLTGSSGKLGTEVKKLFPNTTVTPSSEEMDLRDYVQVNRYLHNWRRAMKKPNEEAIIIHLAALTSPPVCEKDKINAYRTNVEGTANLIDACHEQLGEVYFCLMSTPCCFNGEDENDKDEDYTIYPSQFYGFTKALQECIVSRSGLKHVIIRSNFIPRGIYPYPKAFTDRYSYYLYAGTLAKEIKKVIEVGMEGIVHIQGDKKMSMYDLARLTSPDIKPYTLEEYYKENPNSCKLTKNMCIISTKWPVVKFE